MPLVSFFNHRERYLASLERFLRFFIFYNYRPWLLNNDQPFLSKGPQVVSDVCVIGKKYTNGNLDSVSKTKYKIAKIKVPYKSVSTWPMSLKFGWEKFRRLNNKTAKFGPWTLFSKGLIYPKKLSDYKQSPCSFHDV